MNAAAAAADDGDDDDDDQGVYNSSKYWKSPGFLLMLLEKFIISSVIFC